YRQILQFLAGEINEDEAFEQTIVRTRRFARKQLMWYRKDDRIFWVDALSPHAVGDVLARLEETMTSW
ncbi:MAG: tRNA (adenosine(37)-N6)-dimethylallyltransferase MiaA, partial [Propionibacterium sp.]|nr:tRNA (adenosine(37)-N6)-dimethylallyltransferase MiaA [Propionibacterium sp.]